MEGLWEGTIEYVTPTLNIRAGAGSEQLGRLAFIHFAFLYFSSAGDTASAKDLPYGAIDPMQLQEWQRVNLFSLLH